MNVLKEKHRTNESKGDQFKYQVNRRQQPKRQCLSDSPRNKTKWEMLFLYGMRPSTYVYVKKIFLHEYH